MYITHASRRRVCIRRSCGEANLGCGPKNTVNTVIFATRGTKHRNYCSCCASEVPKTLVFAVFYARKVSKKRENTIYWRFSATTRLSKKLRGQEQEQEQQQHPQPQLQQRQRQQQQRQQQQQQHQQQQQQQQQQQRSEEEEEEEE